LRINCGGAAAERFIDQAGEHGGNEAFEPDALAIDGLLMDLHDFGNGIHLHADEPAVERIRIDRSRSSSARLLINGAGLRQHRLSVEALVADIRIVDATLIF
jgi:hypothetical protein